MEFFNKDILRDEEQSSGFNPGEPDDDTFALGDREYPADMSEFEFQPDIDLIPVPTQLIIDDTPNYAAMAHLDGDIEVMNRDYKAKEIEYQEDDGKPDENVGDLWSNFDEEANLEENNGEIEPEEDVIPADDLIDENEILEPEDLFTDNREFDLPINRDIPDEYSTVPELVDNNVEIAFEGDPDSVSNIEGELDPDFLAKLTKEIKNKPTVIVEEKKPIDEIPSSTKPTFDDNDSDLKFIDLDDLNLPDSPTKAYAKENSKTPVVDSIPEKIEKPIKEKKVKEKKDSKLSPMRIFTLVLVLFLVIFGGLVFLGYNKLVQKHFNEMSESQQIVYLNSPIDENSKEVKKDAEHKEVKDVHKEAEKKAEPEVEKKIEVPIVKEEPKPEPEKIVEKKVEKNAEKAEEKPVIKKEVTKVEKVKVAKVEAPKVVQPKVKTTIITKEEKPKNTKIEPVKIIKPTNTKVVKTSGENKAQNKIPEEFSNINRIPPLMKLDEEGVFTVQIYSSPSKSDAYEWLNKLKQKKVTDGFISEQRIRDQVWYRVRFGSFKTRDEARKAAVGLGFSQSWIDRVK